MRGWDLQRPRAGRAGVVLAVHVTAAEKAASVLSICGFRVCKVACLPKPNCKPQMNTLRTFLSFVWKRTEGCELESTRRSAAEVEHEEALPSCPSSWRQEGPAVGTEKRGPWGCLNWLESELSPGRVRAEPRFLCCKIKKIEPAWMSRF